jgi:beta-glucosidase
VAGLTFLVSGEGCISVGGGGLGMTVQFPDTGGPYDYRTIEVEHEIRGVVGELCIDLTGTVRLARIDVIHAEETA